MKAVIMAGGQGTRLMPLTQSRPKPMMPVMEKPAIGHIVELLKKAGINEIAVSLMYRGEDIKEYLQDGGQFGVSIRYFSENEPKGTAGGVLNCKPFLDGDFLVISGDCVCDFDLSAAVRYHKTSGGIGTVLLHSAPDPTSYGLVRCAADGKILNFVEKPAWQQVFTDSVNTGIYIFENEIFDYIDKNKPCDFARDVFPRLLREGQRINGYAAKGYWCDIGSFSAYLSCNFDWLDGKIALSTEKNGESNYKDTTVRVIEPVFLGRGVMLNEGASVGPYAVLSDCTVSGSVLNSVVIGGEIGKGAVVCGAIVDSGTSIGENARIYDGAVIGKDAKIGKGAVVASKVKIYERVSVAPYSSAEVTITGKLKGGALRLSSCTVTDQREKFTPDVGLKIGAALAAVFGEGDAAVFFDGDCASFASSLISGLGINGKMVYHGANVCMPVATYAPQRMGLSVCAHVKGGNKTMTLHLMDKNGAPLSPELVAKISDHLSDEMFCAANTKMTIAYPNLTNEYIHFINSSFEAHRGKTRICVVGGERIVQTALSIFTGFGAKITPNYSTERETVCFEFDRGGLTVLDENGIEISGPRLISLFALMDFTDGKKLYYTTSDTPLSIGRYGRAVRGEIIRCPRSQCDCPREQYDPIYGAVKVYDFITRYDSPLSNYTKLLPEFAVFEEEVPVTRSRAAVMRAVVEDSDCGFEILDGLHTCIDGGWVHLNPRGEKEAIRIVAEGFNSEMAKELCGIYREKIEKICNRHQKLV